MITLLARQVTCLGPVGLVLAISIGGVVMSDDKDLGKLMLLLVVVCTAISYISKDPRVDVALAIIMFFALLLVISYLARKSRP